MRRKIATIALLGGLAAGPGCQHIGGKEDCGFHPSDYPLGPPTPAYPLYPVVGDAGGPKVDPVPLPKAKDGGSDKDPKEKGKDEKKNGGF